MAEFIVEDSEELQLFEYLFELIRFRAQYFFV